MRNITIAWGWLMHQLIGKPILAFSKLEDDNERSISEGDRLILESSDLVNSAWNEGALRAHPAPTVSKIDVIDRVESMYAATREASRSALSGISAHSRSARLRAKQHRAMTHRGSPETVARLRARVVVRRSSANQEGQR